MRRFIVLASLDGKIGHYVTCGVFLFINQIDYLDGWDEVLSGNGEYLRAFRLFKVGCSRQLFELLWVAEDLEQLNGTEAQNADEHQAGAYTTDKSSK